MSNYTDSFGVTIAEGDVIYSGSSTGGQAKIGRAVFGPNSLLLEDVTYSTDAWRGRRWTTAKRVPCGSLRLVLMRADGSLPSVMHTIMNGEYTG